VFGLLSVGGISGQSAPASVQVAAQMGGMSHASAGLHLSQQRITIIMADQKDIVKDVVEVLHDGHKGFADLSEHIKDPKVKSFFLKESSTRAQFASELESAAGLERDDSGTAAGAMHRTWGDLKGKMGGGDHTILETAEQGEDAAKKAYEEALKEVGAVRPAIRQVLEKQQTHIKQSHDQVKAFRDSKAA
jgi:uncharacterized protein (TIGR02284 family)